MGYFDIVRRAAAQEDPAAKQKCYTKADGTQFCLTHQGSKHNTTDVHEANGTLRLPCVVLHFTKSRLMANVATPDSLRTKMAQQCAV